MVIIRISAGQADILIIMSLEYILNNNVLVHFIY
jgi:hypothetical protein